MQKKAPNGTSDWGGMRMAIVYKYRTKNLVRYTTECLKVLRRHCSRIGSRFTRGVSELGSKCLKLGRREQLRMSDLLFESRLQMSD